MRVQREGLAILDEFPAEDRGCRRETVPDALVLEEVSRAARPAMARQIAWRTDDHPLEARRELDRHHVALQPFADADARIIAAGREVHGRIIDVDLHRNLWKALSELRQDGRESQFDGDTRNRQAQQANRPVGLA
jgi:hypothetical protein